MPAPRLHLQCEIGPEIVWKNVGSSFPEFDIFSGIHQGGEKIPDIREGLLQKTILQNTDGLEMTLTEDLLGWTEVDLRLMVKHGHPCQKILLARRMMLSSNCAAEFTKAN